MQVAAGGAGAKASLPPIPALPLSALPAATSPGAAARGSATARVGNAGADALGGDAAHGSARVHTQRHLAPPRTGAGAVAALSDP
jgi:hypothetical protein